VAQPAYLLGIRLNEVDPSTPHNELSFRSSLMEQGGCLKRRLASADDRDAATAERLKIRMV
jgi:hypothetical protein